MKQNYIFENIFDNDVSLAFRNFLFSARHFMQDTNTFITMMLFFNENNNFDQFSQYISKFYGIDITKDFLEANKQKLSALKIAVNSNTYNFICENFEIFLSDILALTYVFDYKNINSDTKYSLNYIINLEDINEIIFDAAKKRLLAFIHGNRNQVIKEINSQLHGVISKDEIQILEDIFAKKEKIKMSSLDILSLLLLRKEDQEITERVYGVNVQHSELLKCQKDLIAVARSIDNALQKKLPNVLKKPGAEVRKELML